ncbi:MAG: phosphoribosylanthranilate isomerase [Sulfurovum sp.]|nr:MAG: phosphoribosylanthranilate isomerase [Sulfurovum sp.]
MRVKICGITNLEDGLKAIEFGADALGFVFYEHSPRYITPLKAKEIISKLPPFVKIVGLFVNVKAGEVNRICKSCRIDIAQIHFEPDERFFEDINVSFIRVIRASCKEDILKYSDEYRLVDSFVEEFGGSGKRLNLAWFDGVDCSKIILAGGLNPNNLSELKAYNFHGVDVSSGVERAKGLKDVDKMAEFMINAKNL